MGEIHSLVMTDFFKSLRYTQVAILKGGMGMVYIDLVMILNFLVDFLLLMGTNRLCGYLPGGKRCAIAAALGAVYAGVCLLPGFSFLGNGFWRCICLALLSLIAFGKSVSALRRGMVFVVLSMALGGIALGMGSTGFLGVILGAGMVFVLCFAGFRDKIGSVRYVPVTLRYGSKVLELTALEDTGNHLKDPVTGRSVLVIDGRQAEALTGLTREQISQPVQTMLSAPIPGLRLIPYHTVGQPGGMLLALRLPEVQIGKWKGASLVAFAPDKICVDGAYQALTGGI